MPVRVWLSLIVLAGFVLRRVAQVVSAAIHDVVYVVDLLYEAYFHPQNHKTNSLIFPLLLILFYIISK